MITMVNFLIYSAIAAIPNICDVINTSHFKKEIDLKSKIIFCGFPPRACAHITYNIPKYFIEVVDHPSHSLFKKLPGAKLQLSSLKNKNPSGVDNDNGSFSFDGHILTIPLAGPILSSMPCENNPVELTCFLAMSEQLGDLWKNGKGDLWQPYWLLWSKSPKACLAKGAAMSFTGNLGSASIGFGSEMCSFNLDFLSKIIKFPPSNAPVCTGWGIHFPRTSTVTSSDTTAASLVIASRIKSLGTEVFRSVTSSLNDKWQMIYPQASSCFKEGENLTILAAKNVGENQRILNRPRGFLYAIWQQRSCIKEVSSIATSNAAIEIMKLGCKGAK